MRNSLMSRSPAKYLLPSIVVAFAILGAAAATAAELPAYEAASLPATPVQLTVLGASRARALEQAPTATLTRNDMPATALQLSVLAPHRRSTASKEAMTTVGSLGN
jgi:hypothetical protein